MMSPMKLAISSCIWRSARWLCSVLWHGSGQGVYMPLTLAKWGVRKVFHWTCIGNLTLKHQDYSGKVFVCVCGGKSQKIENYSKLVFPRCEF